MLAHNYPSGVDKIQLFTICLSNDEQYVTVWLFISADLYCRFVYTKGFCRHGFTVGEKAMSHQTNCQTTEIKGVIDITSTFSLRSDSCV